MLLTLKLLILCHTSLVFFTSHFTHTTPHFTAIQLSVYKPIRLRVTQNSLSMEIIKTNRGADKLCLDGYMYVKKRIYSNWIRWQCTHQRSSGCKGALTTDDSFDNPRSFVSHNHLADRTGVEVTKLRTTMKATARNSKARPNQILTQALLETSVQVRANIGNISTCKRDLQRQRRGCLPKDPTTRQDLVIPEEWTTTGEANPQPFLIHDTGPGERQRVLVYASEEQLRHLGRSDTWFMDGNFAMSPSVFEQLYVIRAPLGDSAVSCVYAFLPGKSAQVYQELLQAVLNKMETMQIYPDPRVVITDFELAAIQAVPLVLGPQVATQGCFYHLTQSTWRKIQDLGLTDLYRSNDEVRHFCGMLDGLAFLPEDKVLEGMAFLREHTPAEVEPLVNYFDTVYVTGSFRRVQLGQLQPGGPPPPIRVRNIPPRFGIPLWNVHTATLEDRNRTNNMCEGWNTSFSQLIGHQHPSFWTAVDGLRRDYALVSTHLLQHSRGQPMKKRQRRQHVQQQKRLRSLCQDIVAERRTLPEFLEAVGHCIRLD